MTKQNKFFTIPRAEVLTRLPEETISFYQDANYLDLTTGNLHVSRDLIGTNGKIVDNVDRDQGKITVNNQGLQLPSAALMYKVIIPHLRAQASQDENLKKVLESMSITFEFLEDIVIQVGHQRMARDERTFWDEIGKPPHESYALRLKVGNKEIPIALPYKIKGTDRKFWDYDVNGQYNLGDLNAFGFPTTLRENGEFKYWGPNDFNRPIGRELYPSGGRPQGEVATIRYKTLGLLLNFRPKGDIQDNLGVRGVKIN